MGDRETSFARGDTSILSAPDAPGRSTVSAGEPTNRPHAELERRAYHIRKHALRMGAVQGQGYIGQALGIADVLAVSYFRALAYRSDEPTWEGRDRFLLSIGHYAIALYAALIESGTIPQAERETYGSDDSRLPMSGMASYTPGMEISGGSLGQGLGIAVGMALGLKRKRSGSFVFNLLSDGEVDEGSTWEAVMSGAHHRLDNLVALVDFNNMQADGPSQNVLATPDIAGRFRAFGWHAVEVDGNDVGALVEAFDTARALPDAVPRAIVCRTRMGRGVPFLENREQTHFTRVDEAEWDEAVAILDAGWRAGGGDVNDAI